MSTSSHGERSESDLLGDISVPANALYGAQTQRAVLNFPVRQQRALGDFPCLVKGLVFCKQAAAIANRSAGLLKPAIADAIVAAGDHIIKAGRYDQFPIHHLHGGGGTSANMNANEVIANIAEEALGGRRGQYQQVHPNDHVNLNQSTNDVYPAACHIAALRQWPATAAALRDLAALIDGKAAALNGQQRIARTCLQDAVAIGFADLLGGYKAFLERGIAHIDRAVDALHAVAIGGTIVGRARDVPAAYMTAIIPALCKVTGDGAFRHNENLFDAAQNLDDMVRVCGEMDVLARGIVKLCKDLRLMNSGPETGFGEVHLPPVQPGSSMMPGKINPVIPEFAVQLCFKVMGFRAMCQVAVDHGELDLNVWESVVICGLLESMELLQIAAETLGEKGVAGLRVDVQRNNRNIDTIIPLLTELMKRHGYSNVSAVCKQGGGDLPRLRELLEKSFCERPLE